MGEVPCQGVECNGRTGFTWHSPGRPAGCASSPCIQGGTIQQCHPAIPGPDVIRDKTFRVHKDRECLLRQHHNQQMQVTRESSPCRFHVCLAGHAMEEEHAAGKDEKLPPKEPLGRGTWLQGTLHAVA